MGVTPVWLQDSELTGGIDVQPDMLLGVVDTPGYAYDVTALAGMPILLIMPMVCVFSMYGDLNHPVDVGFYDTPGLSRGVAVSRWVCLCGRF